MEDGQMKIGNLEGDPEEIRNFIENNGLNINDFLDLPKKRPALFWFIIPGFLFFVVLFWLTLFSPTSDALRNLLFLIGCLAGIWQAVNVQIRFQNPWAATFIGVGIPLVMLVAIGVLSPAELVNELKGIKSK